MKKIVLVLLLLLSFAANAQQKGPNGKPGDFVEAAVERMTTLLTLDGFQAAAIRNFMDDYKKEAESIAQLQIPGDAKLEKYTAANEKLEAKILSVLNKDQIKIYYEEKDKKDKKKKGKKGKDKKTEGEH